MKLKWNSASKAANALVEKKASTNNPRVSREVAKLLQDEGAERIMQEMEGKGANRKRTATNDRFYGEKKSHVDKERLISDEVIKKTAFQPNTSFKKALYSKTIK